MIIFFKPGLGLMIISSLLLSPEHARFLTKNQHTQRFFIKSVDLLRFIKKVPKLFFQSQFSMSKIDQIKKKNHTPFFKIQFLNHFIL